MGESEAFVEQQAHPESERRPMGNWPAGFWEVAGDMTIVCQSKPQVNPTYIGTYPVIEVSDERARIEHLARVLDDFHPRTYPRRHASLDLRIGGRSAVALAQQMVAMSVWRRPMLEAMIAWKGAPWEDRVRFAREAREAMRERFDHLSAADYSQAVADPDFVAGVVDNRGRLADRVMLPKPTKGTLGAAADHDYGTTVLVVQSLNRVLLDACQAAWGGSVSVHLPEGVVRKGKDMSFTTKRASHVWYLAHYDVVTFLDRIGSHLRVRTQQR